MSDRGHDPSSAAPGAPAGADEDAGAVMTGGMEHLDFGVRNTLLYYKDLKTTLDLTPGSGANASAVDRLLALERVPLSEIFDSDPEALRSAAKRVRSISYRARRDIDKGAPGTLCVAWGLATWDTGRPAVPAAPIVLRQASVGRFPGTAEDFDLGVSGPWSLNVTLLRLLEIDFEVDVEREALSDLVEELTVTGDPEPLFDRVTKMAADVPDFSIASRVVLAPVPRIAMVSQPDVVRSRPADGALMDVAPTAGATTVVDPDVLADQPALDQPALDHPALDQPALDQPALDHVSVDDVAVDAPPVDLVAPFVVENSATGKSEAGATADTVELFRSGMLDPKKLGEGTFERRIVERFGADVVIADITATLRGDSWPEALIEHADSGLRVRDRSELFRRWYEASPHRPRPSRWDATHFALWGLAAAPPAGDPAIRSVARWGERRHHPVLAAWEMVAGRRMGTRRHGRHGRRIGFAPQRVTIPKGIDEALWGLPVDLLVEWAAWVFRQWPGAPMELLLPVGTPELLSAWYDRARPVVELAVKTWVPFAQVDNELGKSAHRWVKQLTNACGGGGAPLATWFERSMVAATEAVAVRLGDDKVAGAGRGRRNRGRNSVGHTEHAI